MSRYVKITTLRHYSQNLPIREGLMEDEILAAIKKSVPTFVAIAKAERPDADAH
jgi:hypothetical protein